MREPENIVDEQQHVLAFFIAEIFCYGQARQTDAQPRPRRLGHLAVDQRHFRFPKIMRIDNLRLLHFEPQVVPLARPLSHAREHRHTAVLQRDVVDQFHDDNGLADTSAPEQADLPATHIGLQQIDYLDARFEHLQFRRLLFKGGSQAMNRPTLGGIHRTHFVDRFADHIQHAA